MGWENFNYLLFLKKLKCGIMKTSHIFLALILFLNIYSCEKQSVIQSTDLETDSVLVDLSEDTLSLILIEEILKEYHVMCIEFYKSATWIGTYEQGLIEYKNNEPKLIELPVNTVIHSIDFDNNENIWLGTSNGIIMYDYENFTIFNNENTIIPSSFVYPVIMNGKNQLYGRSSTASTGGLVHFNGNDWKLFTPENSKLKARGIDCFVEDSDGYVWFPNGDNLVKIEDTIIYNISLKKLGIPSIYSLTDIFQNKNTVILSTNEIVGCIYNQSSAHLPYSPLLYKKSETESIVYYPDPSNIQFNQIAIDNYDNIWGSGSFNRQFIYKFDYEKIQVIDTKDRFSSILTFAFDKDNRLWIGSDSGIKVYNIE